jgi:hypothetical protein
LREALGGRDEATPDARAAVSQDDNGGWTHPRRVETFEGSPVSSLSDSPMGLIVLNSLSRNLANG